MDLERFQIPNNQPRLSQRRRYNKFLKGPIPLNWLQAAARLPGKTVQVGVALQYLRGLKRSLEFKFSYKLAEKFGANRYAAYRALKALEEAGLVKVTREVGRSPTVQLIEVPD